MFYKIFHTLVLSVIPALTLYSNNLDRVSFSETIIPMLVILSASLTGLWVIHRLTRNIECSALIVTIWLVVILNFAPIWMLLIFLTQTIFSPTKFAICLILCSVLTSYFIIRRRWAGQLVIKFLNTLATSLIVFLIAGLVYRGFVSLDTEKIELTDNPFASTIAENEHYPDVYYIITDSYTGNNILKEKFEYDNSGFTNFLEEKGFYVAYNSRSNYCSTDLSLSCSLNMSYLNLIDGNRKSYNSVEHQISLIHNSRVRRILEKIGYKSIAFSSGYLVTDFKDFDTFFTDSIINKEFLDVLLCSTIFPYLELPFFNLTVVQTDSHRHKIKRALTEMPRIKKTDSPVFVLVHIVCPHAPFVFGKNGEELVPKYFSYADGNSWIGEKSLYKKSYAKQVEYLNTMLKDCINKLMQDTVRDKIILLQADHGSGLGHHYTDIDQCDLNDRFSILNAIYLPDKDYRRFYQELSPVNNFRLVLGKILGKQAELLEDRSFYSPSCQRFDFVDVTERLE